MSNVNAVGEPITKLAAIKGFFEADGGKKVEMAELVQLKKNHPQDVDELATMAAAAMGRPLANPVVNA